MMVKVNIFTVSAGLSLLLKGCGKKKKTAGERKSFF
ncbi:MAG: hypothetical protein BWX87_00047 [Bacteroidetes bacterium ADurb.Bin123]|jgi:hypothetical protein|nr:MAG: hypothetical protein BWX87_00047 [Bacteroidetes bacterium ADurb.Bin123]